MNKAIKNITRQEYEDVKSSVQGKLTTVFVDIDGSQVQSWDAFSSVIEKSFHFPSTCIDSKDRFVDWMTDLTWLEVDTVILVLRNYNAMFLGDEKLKEQVLSMFDSQIIPWWQGEVKKFMVGGKQRILEFFS